MSRRLEWSVLALCLCAALPACSDEAGEEPLVSSRAYKGHESDKDANNFVAAYPDALGTRLDDCQTCHKGGTFTSSASGKTHRCSRTPATTAT